MDDGNLETDIAGVVLRVITELKPEISAEISDRREGEDARV